MNDVFDHEATMRFLYGYVVQKKIYIAPWVAAPGAGFCNQNIVAASYLVCQKSIFKWYFFASCEP